MSVGTSALLALGGAAVGGLASGIGGSVVNSIASGGAGSNPSGSGFQAQQAQLQQGADPRLVSQSVDQSQGALNQQQQLVNALQAQNGIGNQTNVYNQLQGVANGTGPNPAQAQLAQATGANVANQAALMAGQRGAGANAGLIARQAAQQGGALQQNAAGQAATLQAQQSLNALGQMGSLANQQAGQQIGATQNNTAAQQAQLAQMFGAQQAYNQANISNVGQANAANAGIANTNANNQYQNAKGIAGGITGGIGAALPAVFGSNGSSTGSVPTGTSAGYGSNTTNINPNAGVGQWNMLAEGGQVGSANLKENYSGKGPRSRVGQHLASGGKINKVDVVLSPGEKVLTPEQAQKAKAGASISGKTVPGKAAVGGSVNSYSNDTYETKLKPGSVVLPRSVTQAKDPKEAEARFLETLKSKKKGK